MDPAGVSEPLLQKQLLVRASPGELCNVSEVGLCPHVRRSSAVIFVSMWEVSSSYKC